MFESKEENKSSMKNDDALRCRTKQATIWKLRLNKGQTRFDLSTCRRSAMDVCNGCLQWMFAMDVRNDRRMQYTIKSPDQAILRESSRATVRVCVLTSRDG